MSKVISIRLPDEANADIERISQELGMTVSDVLRICLEGISHGHYEIVDRELVPTNDYLNVIGVPQITVNADMEYEELGFGSVLRKLRDKGYPDRVIKSMMGNFLIQINDGGVYNSKKSSNWGA